MNIHESCKGWNLEYNNPEMGELAENEQKTLSAILHLAGDVLASYNSIPKDIDQNIRDLVLDSLAVIFMDTKDQVVSCIENSISMHAINTPLGKGYTEEEIFGINLADEFKSVLTDEKELAVAAEHFHGLHEAMGEDEDDDDGLN